MRVDKDMEFCGTPLLNGTLLQKNNTMSASNINRLCLFQSLFAS